MTFEISGATIRLRLRGGHRLRQCLGCIALGVNVHVGVDIHGVGGGGVMLGEILSLD